MCDQSSHNTAIKLVKKKKTLTAKTFCVICLICLVDLTEYSTFSTEHTVKNKHDKTKLFQTVCSVTDGGFFSFSKQVNGPHIHHFRTQEEASEVFIYFREQTLRPSPGICSIPSAQPKPWEP